MITKILTIPGYGGSGEKHWQTLWETDFENIQRVEQDDWDNPQLALWVERLNAYIPKDEKVILVGHSLACALISHWALKYDASSIIGALLVSPADVDSSEHTLKKLEILCPCH